MQKSRHVGWRMRNSRERIKHNHRWHGMVHATPALYSQCVRGKLEIAKYSLLHWMACMSFQWQSSVQYLVGRKYMNTCFLLYEEFWCGWKNMTVQVEEQFKRNRERKWKPIYDFNVNGNDRNDTILCYCSFEHWHKMINSVGTAKINSQRERERVAATYNIRKVIFFCSYL